MFWWSKKKDMRALSLLEETLRLETRDEKMIAKKKIIVIVKFSFENKQKKKPRD